MPRLPHLLQQWISYTSLLHRYAGRGWHRYGMVLQTNSPLHVLSRLPFHVKLVVDAGANEGRWTRQYRMVLGEESEFHLIEPLPQLVTQLKQEFHSRPRCVVHGLALSSSEGTATLNVASANDYSSLEELDQATLHERAPRVQVEYTERVTVPIETLTGFYDRVIPARTVDLLKMDLQGHEGAVLESGADALARTRAVLIEWNIVNYYSSTAKFSETHQLLEGLGFTLCYIPFQYEADHQLIYADALYVNPRLLKSTPENDGSENEP